MKGLRKCLYAVMATVALVFGACSDDDEAPKGDVPYNPGQPVTVTDFSPKSAGYQAQLLVYGSNFGNDKSRVKVYVGGKEAVIVNVMSDKLYAYVPSGVDGTTVEVAVVNENGDELARGISPADKPFEYVKRTVVGTLCGYKNDLDTQGEVYGSFDVTTGFRQGGCMYFDPLYPERMFVIYDGGHRIDLIDLDKRTNTLMMSPSKFQDQRIRSVGFVRDGQYMVVSSDRDDNYRHSQALWIVKRNDDGTFSDQSEVTPLACYRNTNCCAVHPVNGEVYFNSYEMGQMFRLDIEKFFDYKEGRVTDSSGNPMAWSGYLEDGCYEELYVIRDLGWEFTLTIHPTGNYAYINVCNRDYILRTDYDWENKRFTSPYLIAGKINEAGWVDGIGGNTRIHRPYQGVFVKNPEYAGRADEYDYYFSDSENFCVRYITPEGMVRTYAGRSPSPDNNVWGSEDGGLRTQARFNDITGLTYDPRTETFYVLDQTNRRMRTIGKEDADK